MSHFFGNKYLFNFSLREFSNLDSKKFLKKILFAEILNSIKKRLITAFHTSKAGMDNGHYFFLINFI